MILRCTFCDGFVGFGRAYFVVCERCIEKVFLLNKDCYSPEIVARIDGMLKVEDGLQCLDPDNEIITVDSPWRGAYSRCPRHLGEGCLAYVGWNRCLSPVEAKGISDTFDDGEEAMTDPDKSCLDIEAHNKAYQKDLHDRYEKWHADKPCLTCEGSGYVLCQVELDGSKTYGSCPDCKEE